MKKPIDQAKRDVRPLKTSAPKAPIEKNKPSINSKSTLVVSYLEKDNTSPNEMKATQNGKFPPKSGKTGMFTLPYPIYNIDYNIVDDLKKS